MGDRLYATARDLTMLQVFQTYKVLTVILLVAGIAFCLSQWGSAALALLAGVGFALLTGNPYQPITKKLTSHFLSWSIIGLGAGMNLIAVGQVGLSGLGITFVSISLTLALGLALGRLLLADRETSLLIAVGTAICGGSAIAAIAPVIRAKPQSIAVALGTVFMLNAAALFLFPTVGHIFNLGQVEFGTWSALAIHDTSSVVGAGLQYGAEALQTGVTIKLARALWIVPLTLVLGHFYRHPETGQTAVKPKKPWFILGFLSMAALVTWVPDLQPYGHMIENVARKGMVVTLFLIGANLTLDTLRAVGLRPLLQGVILWIIVSLTTLMVIPHLVVH